MGNVVAIILQIVLCILSPENCPLTPPGPAPTPTAPTPPTPPPPTPTGNFQIRLINTGSINTYNGFFEEAKAKWESVIIGDLGDVSGVSEVDLFSGVLAQPSSQVGVASVDDVVIGYEFEDDLGPGVLGFAGPTFIRNDLTPLAGIMKFSSSLFAQSTDADNRATVLHEMGHVLGIGTLWGPQDANCDGGCQVNGRGSVYGCSQAAQAYTALKATTTENFGTNQLRLSNDGGSGSQCGHWEDDSFNAQNWLELMTPFADSRTFLLTIVSLGALRDISDSYVTNDAAADPIPDSASTIVDWGIKPDISLTGRGEVFLIEAERISDVLGRDV